MAQLPPTCSALPETTIVGWWDAPMPRRRFLVNALIALAGLPALAGCGGSPELIAERLYLQVTDPERIKFLIPALASTDERVRANTARYIGRLGAKLSRFGPETKTVVVALAGRLGDDSALVRRRATTALRQLVREPKISVPALIEAMTDSDPKVREQAAIALGKFGKRASEAVQVLSVASRDAEPDVQSASADALRKIFKKIGSSEPPAAADLALRRVVTAGDEESLKHNLRALGKIDGDRVVPALVASLKNPAVRIDAILRLGSFGPVSEPAAIPIASLLRDRDPRVRRRSAWALGMIGSRREDILVALGKTRQDRASEQVRKTATEALLRIFRKSDDPWVSTDSLPPRFAVT